MSVKGTHHATFLNGNEIYMMYCPGCGHHGIKFKNNRLDGKITEFTLSTEAFIGLYEMMRLHGFDEKTIIEDDSK